MKSLSSEITRALPQTIPFCSPETPLDVIDRILPDDSPRAVLVLSESFPVGVVFPEALFIPPPPDARLPTARELMLPWREAKALDRRLGFLERWIKARTAWIAGVWDGKGGAVGFVSLASAPDRRWLKDLAEMLADF